MGSDADGHQQAIGGRPGVGRPPIRFEALDSWRGIAAIMVVLFHCQIVSHVRGFGFVRGAEGFVDFFFVLSGFVIAHTYLDRLPQRRDLAQFLVRRFGRLYPLHVFMLGLFLAFELAKSYLPGLVNPADPSFSGTNELSYLPSNLLLLQALFPIDSLSWNTPSWSISAEFVVYALFGLAVVFCRPVLGLCLVAAVAVAAILLAGVSGDGMHTTVGLSVFRALFGFAVGVLLYRMAKGPIMRVRGQGDPDHAGRNRVAAWTAAELAIVGVIVLAVIHASNSALAYLTPFVFALAVGIFAVEGGHLSRLLKLRPFLVVGALSYSIYMTHMFVLLRLTNLARLSDSRLQTGFLSEIGRTARYGIGIDTGNPYTGDLLMAAVVLITIGVSYVTWRLIEKPGQRLFDGLSRRISGAPAKAANIPSLKGAAAASRRHPPVAAMVSDLVLLRDVEQAGQKFQSRLVVG